MCDDSSTYSAVTSSLLQILLYRLPNKNYLWRHNNIYYFIWFYLPYSIEYNAHTSIVRTSISQWFLAKNLILFFKNYFTRINHCKFIHHKTHLKPFISYLPCLMCREYFSIIFKVKKCSLYSIKYGIFTFFLWYSCETQYCLSLSVGINLFSLSNKDGKKSMYDRQLLPTHTPPCHSCFITIDMK
jgi:hypothetical protein